MLDYGEFSDHEVDAPNHAMLHTEAEVACPWCGETVVIGLDPAGGAVQDYVEDCAVCCQPWQIRVEFDGTGMASVWADPA